VNCWNGLAPRPIVNNLDFALINIIQRKYHLVVIPIKVTIYYFKLFEIKFLRIFPDAGVQGFHQKWFKINQDLMMGGNKEFCVNRKGGCYWKKT
jgi:hypothetical protein